ncbi:MAG: TetR/AcrR family transcriptional regulator [Anaerolineales bacterium]|nr:TetR/AcrR family transcriptional regulator [Anaerolineales bacterium]
MPPNSNVSEKRKNQILDAAMKTFSEMGFHKARMSDIADTSGLSKGSLYWYFDSKDSIILNLLEKFFEPELNDLKALLTDSRSAEDRLGIYVDRVSDDMVSMLKWMPLIHDFIALAFRKEPVRKAISNYYQRHLEILLSLIQQGLDSGEFQADSAMEASIAIGSILEGTVLLWVYDPSQIDIKHHIKSNINLLLKGLKTKPALVTQIA